MNREVSLMMVCSSTCRVVVEHQDWRRDAQRTENESLDEGFSWRNKGVKGFKKYWGGKYVRWLGGNRKNEPNVTLMFSWLWQSQCRRETCECGKWWPWQCSPAVTHWHAYHSAGWCVSHLLLPAPIWIWHYGHRFSDDIKIEMIKQICPGWTWKVLGLLFGVSEWLQWLYVQRQCEYEA